MNELPVIEKLGNFADLDSPASLEEANYLAALGLQSHKLTTSWSWVETSSFGWGQLSLLDHCSQPTLLGSITCQASMGIGVGVPRCSRIIDRSTSNGGYPWGSQREPSNCAPQSRWDTWKIGRAGDLGEWPLEILCLFESPSSHTPLIPHTNWFSPSSLYFPLDLVHFSLRAATPRIMASLLRADCMWTQEA